ncbi:hypothetical protein ISCGN_025122 [Ixodes scapularis]
MLLVTATLARIHPVEDLAVAVLAVSSDPPARSGLHREGHTQEPGFSSREAPQASKAAAKSLVHLKMVKPPGFCGETFLFFARFSASHVRLLLA